MATADLSIDLLRGARSRCPGIRDQKDQKDTHRALNDDDFIERIRRPSPQRKLLLIGEIDPQAAWLCTNAHSVALRVLSSFKRSPRSFSIPCCQQWALKASRSKIAASSSEIEAFPWRRVAERACPSSPSI
jgi:hypothetical protein